MYNSLQFKLLYSQKNWKHSIAISLALLKFSIDQRTNFIHRNSHRIPFLSSRIFQSGVSFIHMFLCHLWIGGSQFLPVFIQEFLILFKSLLDFWLSFIQGKYLFVARMYVLYVSCFTVIITFNHHCLIGRFLKENL